MADKQSLNDIFQRYLNNECSTYEIKYLLKHFISGSNDDVLREIIADKLRDQSVDEHQQFQNPTLSWDETFKTSIQKTEPETEGIAETAKNRSFFDQPMFIKIIAIVTLTALLCESLYAYFS